MPRVSTARARRGTMAHCIRLRHRRRRLGRLRAGQPAVRRSREPGAGAGGRPAGLPVGRLHPHAGGADLPDRQPVLRLEVRVRARAAHERPADLPRPRQGAGRLQQHQRHDLPARQPAWTTSAGRADPGMETWDYAHCLPYFQRMENCLAADPDDEFRGHDGPLVLERGPATNPLFGAFFEAAQRGGLRADRRRQRLPAGGLRRVRPQHPARPPAVGRAGLPAARDEAPEPRRSGPARSSPGSSSRASGPSASSTSAPGRAPAGPRRRGHPVRRRDQLAAAAPALRSRQRAGAERPRHRRRRTTCPGVGENLQDHLEVYVQYACTQPVSMQPYMAKWRAALHRAAVAVRAGARRPPTTSRPAASPAATTTSTTRT